MLNILGEMIQVPQLGNKLIGTINSPVRPRAGYRHPQEMLKAVNYDEALFARFKEYVTTYAWVDPCVANPVPLSQGKVGDYPVRYYRGTPPIYRHGGRRRDAQQPVAGERRLQPRARPRRHDARGQRPHPDPIPRPVRAP